MIISIYNKKFKKEECTKMEEKEKCYYCGSENLKEGETGISIKFDNNQGGYSRRPCHCMICLDCNTVSRLFMINDI